MTKKTKIFLKKELFGIVFSISAFIVLVTLYWVTGKITDIIRGTM